MPGGAWRQNAQKVSLAYIPPTPSKKQCFWYIRVLLMVVIGTSMMHVMVMKENHQENVNKFVQGLFEIGATGQQNEWVGDQERPWLI